MDETPLYNPDFTVLPGIQICRPPLRALGHVTFPEREDSAARAAMGFPVTDGISGNGRAEADGRFGD